MSSEGAGSGQPNVASDAQQEPAAGKGDATATAVAEPAEATPAEPGERPATTAGPAEASASQPSAGTADGPDAAEQAAAEQAVAEPGGAQPGAGEPDVAGVASSAITDAETAETEDELEDLETREYEEYDEDLDSDEYVEDAGSGEQDAPRRARRWPRVLLAFGFLVLAAGIVAAAIVIVGSLTHGFKKPVKVTYTKSPLFSLKTGECLDPSGQSYTLISCDSPHQAEVYATFTLAGKKWPGSAAVAAQASSGCSTRLTGYLNPQLAVSLASTYVYPDATAWKAGTRTVICEVRATSGDLTGSVRSASATSG